MVVEVLTMTIGKKIQIARKKAKYTQKTLAELCGVATGTIQQYELGKRQPRYEQLQIIAKALNMHLYDFLDDEFFYAATAPATMDNAMAEIELMVQRIKSIETNPSLSVEEKQRLIQDFFAQTEIMADIHLSGKTTNKYLLNKLFEKLNSDGQEKAIAQIEMLTKIPEYQRESLKNYAEFVSDKTPEYWDGLEKTLQQIDAGNALTSEPEIQEEKQNNIDKHTQD